MVAALAVAIIVVAVIVVNISVTLLLFDIIINIITLKFSVWCISALDPSCWGFTGNRKICVLKVKSWQVLCVYHIWLCLSAYTRYHRSRHYILEFEEGLSNFNLINIKKNYEFQCIFLSPQAVLLSVVPCYGVMYLPLMALGYSNTQVATIPSLYLGFTNLLGMSSSVS